MFGRFRQVATRPMIVGPRASVMANSQLPGVRYNDSVRPPSFPPVNIGSVPLSTKIQRPAQILQTQPSTVEEMLKNITKDLTELKTLTKDFSRKVSKLQDEVSDFRGETNERYARSVIGRKPLTVNGLHDLVPILQREKAAHWVSETVQRSEDESIADTTRAVELGRTLALEILGLMHPILTSLVRMPGSDKPTSISAFSQCGEKWTGAIIAKKTHFHAKPSRNHPKLHWLLNAVERLFAITSEEEQLDALQMNDGLGLTFLMFLAQQEFDGVSFGDELPKDRWESLIIRTIHMDVAPEVFFRTDGARVVHLGEIISSPKGSRRAGSQMWKQQMALDMATKLLKDPPLKYRQTLYLPRKHEGSEIR